MSRFRVAVVGLVACFAPWAEAADGPAKYVIHISVDGLAPRYLQALIDEGQAPNFKRLQSEGVWTHNARTDHDFTVTLPNHTSMLTGRPVRDKEASPSAILGHRWMVNSETKTRTLHTNRHDYVPSAFDVAHDHGLRTGLFPSKSKFIIYDRSYGERHGAPDKVGADNGRDKIDVYEKVGAAIPLNDRFIAEMKADPFHYSFVHYRDPDSAGHGKGWGSPEYNDAIRRVDKCLGQLFEMITGDERFAGRTAIVLSADHGGTRRNHGIFSDPLNYVIPFYVWGAGVEKPGDLYALNESSRVDPKADRCDFVERDRQPIRNGDGGNLALDLLGLGPIPDSAINAAQDLKVK